ncbi:glycosyltransferase [Oceanibaculum pacificum]|uniref:glycosyltransferase n=1 Tax=Oceanibaculum pacificum TaxID=580166 RepID=UPI0018DB1BF5|nr:glycosyltransferase [Oceanibaculum pacificum]
MGIVRNGGIGTACTELSKAFAADGAAVTVLFSQVGALTRWRELEEVKASYYCQGIDLVVAEEWADCAAQSNIFPPHPLLRMSRIVHDWLKEQEFDVVLFMDWQGMGFYPMMARRAGLAHRQHGVFAVICHGPTLWSDLGNTSRRRDPLDAITYFIERRSIEMADAIFSPSRYLLEWMRGRGFRLPKRVLVQPNLLVTPALVPAQSPPEEVIFFGRLEYRKGLVQFCSAIDCLVAHRKAPKRVVFLGKFGFVGEEHAALYIARRSRDWPMPVEILSRLNQPEALRILTQRRCLAVVPSIVENSPYTVYECLMAGVPVIARDVGGIAELYAPEHRETHLFSDNPNDLADRIGTALSGRLPEAKLSFSPADNRAQWVEGLLTLVSKIKLQRSRKKLPEVQPLVSLCLTHYRRPKLLLQAVRGILAQTYCNIQVILIDDGSAEPETDELLAKLETHPETMGWLIKRVTNGFPGRARNLAAAEARGEYLIFLDDDNVAKPELVESLITAAIRSGADIVTCFASVFEGNDMPGPNTKIIDSYLPVGGALGYALAENSISDTSALIKRSVFREIGCFTEDYGVGHEDFEFFLRAILQEKDILVIPEALYWYRRQASSLGSVTPQAANRSRSLRAFLDHFGPDMAELLVVAHGLLVPTREKSRDDNEDNNLAILAQRDPDSWQSIDAAASILVSRNVMELGKQILLQVPESAPGAEIRRLRADAIEAIRLGEGKLLNDILVQARQLGEIPLREIASWTAKIAWTRCSLFAVDLLLLWTHIDSHALEPRLLLTEALNANGKIEKAFQAFIEAIKTADYEYRATRPDIDAAVVRGEFKMGLVHYERHGQYENAPWPKKERFQYLAEHLKNSLGDRSIAGSQDFVEFLRLSFAVFAPEVEVSFLLQEAQN